MDIIMKATSELVPYENNPRHNEDAVQYVAESIKEFGFKVPIVIDRNNVVIAGHTRLKAAEDLGLDNVPCIVADDLTEEQVKAFRLVDNKTSEFASWDFEELRNELESLADVDMELFGFRPLEEIELGVEDHEFISDTEITKSKAKTITCPHCGEVFEV